jgi:hypothetical protein
MRRTMPLNKLDLACPQEEEEKTKKMDKEERMKEKNMEKEKLHH